jgi:hypothetical protein
MREPTETTCLAWLALEAEFLGNHESHVLQLDVRLCVFKQGASTSATTITVVPPFVPLLSPCLAHHEALQTPLCDSLSQLSTPHLFLPCLTSSFLSTRPCCRCETPLSRHFPTPHQTDESLLEGACLVSRLHPTSAQAAASVTPHRPVSPRQSRHHSQQMHGERPVRQPGRVLWSRPCGPDLITGCAAVAKPRAKLGLCTIHSFSFFSKSYLGLNILEIHINFEDS